MEIKETGLLRSLDKLMPGQSFDQAMTHLLFGEARRKLLRYEAENRRFEQKYQLSFQEFRHRILSSEPNEDTEQDYFDWELAVTGMEDMNAEVKNLAEMMEWAIPAS